MHDYRAEIKAAVKPWRKRLRAHGGSIVVLCPLCKQKPGSFHLTIAKGGKARGSCFPKAPGGPYCVSYIE